MFSKAAAAAVPKPGVSLFTDSVSNLQTATVQVAADLVGAHIETQVCNQAKVQELGKKASISGSSLPYFQLDESTLLTDSTAIARHLIRGSSKAAYLLGETAFAQAQVDQMIALASGSVTPAMKTIEATVFGQMVNPEAHAYCLKSLKETCKVIN